MYVFSYWLHGIFYVMPILITGTEKQKYDSEHSYNVQLSSTVVWQVNGEIYYYLEAI